MLNDKPFQFDMYLVIGIKTFVKTLVEKNTYLRELGEDIREGSLRDIVAYGLECEDNEIVIVELCKCFKITITLFFLQKNSDAVIPKKF